MSLRRRPVVALLAVLALPRSAAAGPSDLEEHRALVVSAQVLQRNGKLLRAREIYLTCASDACSAGAESSVECERIRDFCGERLASLDRETPTILPLVVDDRGARMPLAKVRVGALHVVSDGPIPVDPGHYLVRAEFGGRVGIAEVDIVAAMKQTPVRVVIDLRRYVTVRPTPGAVYALGIASGVAFLAGAVFAAAVQDQRSETEFCRPTCDPSGEDGHRFRTIATDANLVGGTVLGLGALLSYLTRPARTQIERVGGVTSDR